MNLDDLLTDPDPEELEHELARGQRLIDELAEHLKAMGGAEVVTIPLSNGNGSVRVQVFREHVSASDSSN